MWDMYLIIIFALKNAICFDTIMKIRTAMQVQIRQISEVKD